MVKIKESQLIPHLSSFLCILVLLVAQSIYAQIDTEFWFAAPSVTEDHGDRPIVLRFTSFDEAAHVTISQPANPSWRPIEFDIGANASRSIDLTFRINMLENFPAFRVLRHGLHIQSDQPITAYYEVNHEFNPDIFSLKGNNALGTDFLIPAQNYWGNFEYYDPQPFSSFDLVATQDGTEVTIITTVDVPGHSAGNTWTVRLDRGESYSVTAAGFGAADQLTGSRVTANHPIAITLKDDSNHYDPCHDLGGDQLVPIRVLGTEYIVVKGFLQGGDRVFVMATKDATQLQIGDQENAATLNTGEMHGFLLNDASTYIRASAPVYVVHATGFGCEIGLAILPKITCTGSQTVSFTRSTDENFGIILITEVDFQNDFTFNNLQAAAEIDQFSPVPGTNGRYVATQVNLTDRDQTNYSISNRSGSFHLGIINGGDFSGTRYAYFSDFRSLNLLADASRICLGGEVRLAVSGSDNYEWFGHRDVLGSLEDTVSTAPDETTTYGVIGFDNNNGCRDTAYLDVEVYKWPQPDVEISPACIGTRTSIQYHSDESLESLQWIFGQDTFLTDAADSLMLSWQEPGRKEVILQATNPAGCLVDTVLSIEVGGVQLQQDSVISIKAGEVGSLDAVVLSGNLDQAQFRWEPTEGLSCSDCFDPEFSPNEETVYTLYIDDVLGCTSAYRTHVFVDAAIFVPNAFSPDGDNLNDYFEIFAPDVDIDQVQIFNRWGQMYYRWNRGTSSAAQHQFWNGDVDGSSHQAATGVYVYVISGFHQRSGNTVHRSGTVTLMR
ncbi:MAG: hypothetical protein HKN87_05975 [Saprospiraceae bacterium]|nr:hypothetical protein [Saprospiraceae bacterium]